MTKVCRKCGEEKPVSEYYPHPQMTDGHLNYCKTCIRAGVQVHRSKNIDRIRAYDRARGLTEERRKKNKEYMARLKREDPVRYGEMRRRTTTRYRENHPEKYSAHILTDKAIADGEIVQGPCEICGTTNNIIAHHDDYSFPLRVRWFCEVHHKALHRQLSEQARSDKSA